MADYKKYKIGITPKGIYDYAEQYEFLDLVLYDTSVGGDGCAYVALDSSENIAPGTNSEKWMKASQAGSSVYDLAVKYGYFSGTEQEFAQQYQDVLTTATNAAASSTAAQARLENAEALRVQAEQVRVSSEATRVANEVARNTAESDRVSAESARASAETARNTAEGVRVSSEASRTTAETARSTAESARANAESARQTRANSDHSRAEIDHTTAVTDHQNIADKADVDGWYSDMTVGYAENLVDTKSEGTEQQFIFRTSHGTESIADEGSAYIKEIRGSKSVVWNQQLPSSYSEERTSTVSAGGVYSRAAFSIYFTTAIPAGHSVLFRALMKSGNSLSDKWRWYFNGGANVGDHGYVQYPSEISGSYNVFYSYVINPSVNITGISCINASALSQEDTIYYKSAQLFDLTLMFGPGNEPTTVAEFEAMFPKPYYPYNAGTVLNLTADKVVTDGFNQWDEEWINGYYEPDPSAMRAGQFIESSQHICSKNPIPVFPSTSYYTLQTGGYVVFYDSGMNIISNFNHINNNLFTTPSNCRYIHFNCSSSYGATYKHDICINLVWSGYRNGEYEPYKKNERELNLTTLTGKLNGTGNSTVIFPNGLVGIGDVYDEITENKAVKRFGVIDLGTIWWSTDGADANHKRYYCGVSVFPGIKNSSRNTHLLSSIYRRQDVYDLTENFVTYVAASSVYIQDHAVTGSDELRTKLNGVLLYYELATPETYILDEPLKLVYPVEDFGKEWIESVEDASGNPTTTPFRAVIKYNQDFTREIANLPTNYVRRDALKQSIGYDTTLPLSQKGTDDNYARKIGEAPRLIAGSAKNLEGNTAVNEEFVFKAIPSGIGEGAAKVNSVRGKSLVWNQLFGTITSSTINGITFTVNTNGSITISGTATNVAESNNTPYFTQVSNHKYLVRLIGNVAGISLLGRNISGFPGLANLQSIISETTGGGNQKVGIIVANGTSFANPVTVWPSVIDLTLMFGSGNEPTTVAEFEKMFPLPYYDYNPGEIINNQTEEVKVVGFNQWDEEWENGYLTLTGDKYYDANYIMSKNYIRILPNTIYFFRTTNNDFRGRYCFYDADKNLIVTDTTYYNGQFTSPSNAAYLKIDLRSSYGNIYKNDICINISDTNTNGTYKPYEKNTLSLNLSTLTGKLNGEGESVVIFPDGLRSARSVYDEIVGNKAIKRIGSVQYDGSSDENWYLQSINSNGIANFSINITEREIGSTMFNILCDKLSIQYSGLADTTTEGFLVSSDYSVYIRISQTHASTVQELKTYLSSNPICFIFQLGSPEEYILDEQIHDTFQAYSGGTMRQSPENTSTPTSAPMVMNSTYAMNAVGLLNNLPPDYMSKESMQAFLSALQLSGILSSYSMTWNSELGRYVFLLAKQS